MENKSNLRAANKNVMGCTKQATTTKGPYGGNTKYNQMATPDGFAVVKPAAGHTQKSNIKKP